MIYIPTYGFQTEKEVSLDSELIKTYLRSTISQYTLTPLATLSIENAIDQNSHFSWLIKIFADKKAKEKWIFIRFFFLFIII